MLIRLVETAARLTGADRASIWLLSRDGENLLPSAMYGVDEEFLQRWKADVQSLNEELLSREALADGKPVIVLDVANDPRTDKAAVEYFGDKSILIAPLYAAERPQDTLYLNSVGQHHDYSDEKDIQIALSVAGEAALAIDYARIRTESEARGDRLRTSFRRLGDVLATGESLDQTLQLVVKIMVDIVRARGVTIALLDEDRTALVVRATSGYPEMPAGPIPLDPTPDGEDGAPTAGALAARLGAIVGAALDSAPDQPDAALVNLPLVVDERVLGAITITVAGDEPLPHDAELFEGLVRGSAAAIRRVHLQEEARQRLHHFTSLYDLSTAVSGFGDFDLTLRHLVNQVAAVLSVERCAILMVGEPRDCLVTHPCAYGLSSDSADTLPSKLARAPIVAASLDSGKPFVSNDAGDDSAIDAATAARLAEFGDRNLLLVPMRAGNTAVGVIRASNKIEGAFADSDIRLMNIFASQAAVLVQNARLYENAVHDTQQFGAIINGASDGIVIVDNQGCIVHFNRAMRAITGLLTEDLIGSDCDWTLPSAMQRSDDPRDRGALLLKRVLRTGRHIPSSESVIANTDGDRVDLAVSYSFIGGIDGSAPMAAAIVRDVSDVREIERMKSDFVSLVSHELRTPLALIKGYVATLLRPELSLDEDTVGRFHQGINDTADRLGLIVSNLLSTSRIESGLMRPNLQPIDLAPLVDRVVADLQVSAQSRLEVQREGEGCWVNGDAEQVALVLSNLVSNAVKYGRSNIDLQIRVLLKSARREVSVAVIDNGSGIPAHRRDQVFDKFFRAEEAANGQGSGLGLYICRSIVEAHRGRIWIDARYKNGTRISFAFPHIPAPDGAPTRPTPRQEVRP
ncbi:MAG: GAF domain-containing protein [Chloroflexota bacterium]|nr:GAF domain-containing protein [Chloroflexota bacterium]